MPVLFRAFLGGAVPAEEMLQDSGAQRTRFAHPPASGRRHGPVAVKLVVGALCCMVIVGIFFAAYLSPGDGSSGGPSTNSILKRINGEDPIDRILQQEESRRSPVSVEELPDWNTEVWTPIDVEVSADPMVILCKLNLESHWMEPHNSPMFKDLVAISSCVGSNRRRELMSKLLAEIKSMEGQPGGRVIEPTGFVFHESRVGSTLIANMLAADPWALVFSESTPIANAIMHCDRCSRERRVQLFKDVLTLMGRSPFHKRMYVKFQSITTTKMDIALEAFPNTPWAFVFRQPVQTMMSHLDPNKGSTAAAPCLRSKRMPPPEVMASIKAVGLSTGRATNEAWCAAHLNMLCQFAIGAYQLHNTTAGGSARSLLINYDSLPGIVPRALLPLFGHEPTDPELKRMSTESQSYSKNRRTKDRPFESDSEDKDSRATNAIKTYAKDILSPSFNVLDELAIRSFRRVANIEDQSRSIQWGELKPFPERRQLDLVNAGASAVESSDLHSHVIPQIQYHPSLPFSNHHSSRPFERPECPPNPPPGYPKQYSVLKMVENWNPDSTEIPPFHFDSLCHFDYQNSSQLAAAYNYRAKEVPYVVYNVPELDEVVKKWNDIRYVSRRLGNKVYRTETSESNHFMYWSGGRRGGLRDWKPPTTVINTKYKDWLQLAVNEQNKSIEERVHQYFRVSSDAGNEWLYDELPFFKPQRSLFVVEPREQRGIHCRFGMRSVIAEAHFDGSRNSVAMISGLRRWILSSPDQCKYMHMLQRPHPSARHSEVDWSKPDTEKFPNFPKVQANEVILQPGDMLFVPTVWIHYIVSLNINVQCNTRSGIFHGYDKDVRSCGF